MENSILVITENKYIKTKNVKRRGRQKFILLNRCLGGSRAITLNMHSLLDTKVQRAISCGNVWYNDLLIDSNLNGKTHLMKLLKATAILDYEISSRKSRFLLFEQICFLSAVILSDLLYTEKPHNAAGVFPLQRK